MFRTTFRGVPAPIILALMAAPLSLALTVTASEAASPSGTCVSARIDSPFSLPDGSLHPAATLTLCGGRAFSPVATVHKTYVDGRPIGMFVSRTRASEGERATTPSVVFQRDGDGRLDLLGYVLPAEGRDVSYQLNVVHPTAAAGVAAATASLAVVVAAR